MNTHPRADIRVARKRYLATHVAWVVDAFAEFIKVSRERERRAVLWWLDKEAA